MICNYLQRHIQRIVCAAILIVAVGSMLMPANGRAADIESDAAQNGGKRFTTSTMPCSQMSAIDTRELNSVLNKYIRDRKHFPAAPLNYTD